MRTWTKEQLEAINRTGSNIIVSAGAGSGKTTVLTERVITKLKAGIELNELLILTFTNNSAHDMQAKIKKAIAQFDELKNGNNEVENAYITTFDAYVLSLVKKYHYYLDLDKDINIIDNSIILLKKKEIIQDIFKRKYLEKDSIFIKFVTDLCAKNDKGLQKIILDLDKNLDLLIKKRDYLESYLDNFYNENNLSNLFDKYLNIIFKRIKSIENCLYNLSFEVESDFYNKFNNLLFPLINAQNYDELKVIHSINLPNLPRGSSDKAKLYKAQIKKIIDELIIFTDNKQLELIEEVKGTKEYAKIIIEILLELDYEINLYKKEHNSFEFIDISKYAISLLENNPDILNSLKHGFKEIMIDEYQDTNDIQEAFVSLIENNNVYMVGDIKQSIYRFRNANPRIFKNKYDTYKEGKNGYKIDLNRNFRSRMQVVDSINNIFNHVMDNEIGSANYVLDHQMIFGNESYNISSPSDYNLTIYNYQVDANHSNDEVEAFIIARDIQEKIKNKFRVLKDQKLTNCSYSDFCVLMDRTSSFDTYKKVFDYMQIPLNIYKDDNILLNDETFLIKNILTLILKIKNQKFDQDFKFCFTSIARSYLFEIPDEEIFLSITNNDIFKSKIYQICESMINDINYISNKDILEKIIFEFDFYIKMIKVGNIQERNIVLNNLLEKAKDLNKVGIDIYGLEEYFDTLIDNNNEIKVPALLSSSDAVVITNIHKSKGLEYHICYFSGLYKKFNLRDSFEKILFSEDFGFIIPNNKRGLKDTFISTLYKEKYIKDEVSEKIRLFYVALTRCKEKMILVAPFKENNLIFDNNSIADYITRISYRSFLDILSSIYGKIEDKIINIEEIIIPENYLSSKTFEMNFDQSKEKLLVNEIELSYDLLTRNHLSKTVKGLFNLEEKRNVEYGKKIHYILENIDFLNPDFKNLTPEEISVITCFLKHPIMKNIKDAIIIKEYEFQTNDEEIYQSGIIDLLLVYENNIDIIDYKLKNTFDEAYISQLIGYKNYIERKTKKETNAYLYSLLNKELIKID